MNWSVVWPNALVLAAFAWLLNRWVDQILTRIKSLEETVKDGMEAHLDLERRINDQFVRKDDARLEPLNRRLAKREAS